MHGATAPSSTGLGTLRLWDCRRSASGAGALSNELFLFFLFKTISIVVVLDNSSTAHVLMKAWDIHKRLCHR